MKRDTYLKYFLKKLSKLSSEKPSNVIRKWAKDMKGHFTKEDVHMANKPMKRYPTSLAMGEMQMKTIGRHHDTPEQLK